MSDLAELLLLEISKAKLKADRLLRRFGRNKRRHSLEVAKTLRKYGADDDLILSGLYHDTIERGVVKPEKLKGKVGHIVRALSAEKQSGSLGPNAPLEHIKEVLGTMDEEHRNAAILVKLADRISNLNKRIKLNALGKRYLQKSIDLFQYLYSQYTGEDPTFEGVVKEFEQAIWKGSKATGHRQASARLRARQAT